MRRLLLVLLATGLLAAPLRANVEDDLNARWRGHAVVARLAIASDCNGYYNDNDVQGSALDSRADRRFPPGELATVDHVTTHWTRIDVFLDLSEPVLWPLRDGPFTLYEERHCKVQLKLNLPGDVVKRTTPAHEAVLQALELYGSAEQARASASWDRRRREAYPPDYERTVAEHAAWQAAQRNEAVARKLDNAVEDAQRTLAGLRQEPDYLSSFADGARERPDFSDCEAALGAYFSPKKGGKDRHGYEDGQRLAWDLEVARQLKGCVAPPPPPQ